MFYVFLAAVILTGCNDNGNKVEAETEVIAETSEQKELVKTYNKYIEDKQYYELLKDFHTRFVQGETDIEISDEIINVYNNGLHSFVETEGVESFYDYKDLLSDELINEDTNSFIEEEYKKYEDEALKILSDFIDGYYNQKYDPVAIDELIPYGYLENNEEIQTLFAFTDALKYENSELNFTTLLKTVDPYYSGTKGAEIKKFVENRDVTLIEWVNVYNSANGTKLTDEGEGIVDYNPAIGMTPEEVEGSTWGKPDSINRTVTANSIQEQWVYPNYKYLYFEDGIMTSFQE